MSQSEYLEVFIDESEEHLQAINDNLLKLENEPDNMDIVSEIFRSAHTLKGMGATMGFEDLANLTHNMENVLDLIRNGELEVTPEVMDIIFDAVDDIEEMVTDIASGGDGSRDIQEITKQLESLQGIETEDAGEEVAATATAAPTTETSDEIEETFDEYELTVLSQSEEQGYKAFKILVTLDEKTMLKGVRVFMVFETLEEAGEIIKSTPSAEDLENEKFELSFVVTLLTHESKTDIQKRIEKISEIASVKIEEVNVKQEKQKKLALEEKEHQEAQQKEEKGTKGKKEKKPSQQSSSPKEKSSSNKKQKGMELNKTIRVNIDRLDVLMNLFEELVIDRGRLEQISSELNNNELQETVERMSRITGDLQEIILNMRMMPVEQVFNRFPRMVRSLSRELNKKVKLEIIGADTELDRTIIDEIGDPLVHLIRNSLDHGIETPDERVAKGKPEEGIVKLRAFHSGNHVFIEIEDDGAGIDKEKIMNKALENGVVTDEDLEKMTDQQIYSLLFASGFSTAEKVTDVSGRGVGLDVVRTTFESLGGVVTVDSELGKGSLFSIQLPLTLSIIDVMLVEVAQEKYAIPLTAIVETAIVEKKDVYNAHNQKVIDFRGKVVPLVFLDEIFDAPLKNEEQDFYSLVIVHKGEKVAGLVVDSLIGQHDIVLKSLGNYLTNVFAISGATILGDGQVALIVDTNELIK
ncbi:chemotaxis protein CheW [Aliibacillus thermotolerans]|uniref:Chemotaxis protein CheA n=1 Tax=Aliibacillus thermotolerans TaxID=1834418 RepID=A0ABW0U4V6_9BACI|nr:chemotaxis protein CheA [Aliibacillus thermotolerans]MDA3129254.1 chemotaxis protein CheA [Aliibacillus thermotolerans]